MESNDYSLNMGILQDAMDYYQSNKKYFDSGNDRCYEKLMKYIDMLIQNSLNNKPSAIKAKTMMTTYSVQKEDNRHNMENMIKFVNEPFSKMNIIDFENSLKSSVLMTLWNSLEFKHK